MIVQSSSIVSLCGILTNPVMLLLTLQQDTTTSTSRSIARGSWCCCDWTCTQTDLCHAMEVGFSSWIVSIASGRNTDNEVTR